jgi:pimeloyl-ACP methyl ester carboxylesterase
MVADYLVINGNRLYYETTGQGEPLILLHSGIADSRMWQPQIKQLAEHYQVITLDFRGYGKTVYQAGQFWYYEDVYSLAKHLQLVPVNIIGCSLGGRVAIELALQYPTVVKSLILLSPGLKGYEYTNRNTLSWDNKLEKLIALDKKDEVADLLVHIWVVGLRRKRRNVDRGVTAFVKEMILDNYDAVVDRVEEAELGFEVIPRLGEIKAHTLVIVGDEDLPDMLTISQIITTEISQAERIIVPNVAHKINLEMVDYTTNLILSFLGTSIKEGQ